MKTIKNLIHSARQIVSKHSKTDLILAFGIVLFVISLIYTFVLKDLSLQTRPQKLTNQTPTIKSADKSASASAIFDIAPGAESQGIFEALSGVKDSALGVKDAVTGSALNSLALSGSKYCETSSSGAKVTLHVKDTQAKLTSYDAGRVKSQFMVSGDCAYFWEDGLKGSKMCGVKGYVGMYNTAVAAGIFTGDKMQSMAREYGVNVDLLELQKSCVKKEVSSSIFTVPQGVKFEEVVVELPF